MQMFYIQLLRQYGRVYGTFACHALMVPALLRRPREGLQGPEYQLGAVELAVI